MTIDDARVNIRNEWNKTNKSLVTESFQVILDGVLNADPELKVLSLENQSLQSLVATAVSIIGSR